MENYPIFIYTCTKLHYYRDQIVSCVLIFNNNTSGTGAYFVHAVFLALKA